MPGQSQRPATRTSGSQLASNSFKCSPGVIVFSNPLKTSEKREAEKSERELHHVRPQLRRALHLMDAGSPSSRAAILTALLPVFISNAAISVTFRTKD